MSGLLARAANRCADIDVRLTTERKVCAGILSLATVALAVDRLLLGGVSGPASAAAELLMAAGDAASAEDAGGEPRISLATSENVAKQLAALSDVPAVTDAFAPPDRWMAEIRKASLEAAANVDRGAAPEVSPANPAVARFMRRHKLTAVLSEDGKLDRALVKVEAGEGEPERTRVLRTGDVLDGFTLIHMAVDKQSKKTVATFSMPEGGTETVELAIPTPSQE